MTKIGLKLDMSGVYALVAVPVPYIIGRHFLRTRRRFPRAFLVIVGSLSVLRFVVLLPFASQHLAAAAQPPLAVAQKEDPLWGPRKAPVDRGVLAFLPTLRRPEDPKTADFERSMARAVRELLDIRRSESAAERVEAWQSSLRLWSLKVDSGHDSSEKELAETVHAILWRGEELLQLQ